MNGISGNIVECSRTQLSPEIKVARLVARKRGKKKPQNALFEECWNSDRLSLRNILVNTEVVHLNF